MHADLALFLLELLPGGLTRGKKLISSEPSLIVHHNDWALFKVAGQRRN